MTNTHASRLLPRLLLAAALVGAAACDNPVAGGHDEHGDHPVGILLVDSQGEDAVTISEGVASEPVVTGEIAVPLGGAAVFTVYGIAEDGDLMRLDGDEMSVRVDDAPELVEVSLQRVDQLTVTGLQAGSGTLRIELFHEEHAALGGTVPVVVR